MVVPAVLAAGGEGGMLVFLLFFWFFFALYLSLFHLQALLSFSFLSLGDNTKLSRTVDVSFNPSPAEPGYTLSLQTV